MKTFCSIHGWQYTLGMECIECARMVKTRSKSQLLYDAQMSLQKADAEITRLRLLLQTKYESEQNGRPMDHYAWTLGVEDALRWRR
jgi:hypothetical protein